MSSIELRSIRKAFGDNVVIPDLNLIIPDGTFTVLVGPSGCGKTTTLRMIAGLEHPDSGEILIDGENVVSMEPGQRGIAMVFQNYALYPTMTVKGNIEFGLKNIKVPEKERVELIKEVAGTVGLTEYLDRLPSQLSGGQRQRVALARAIVKRPKVFLMDEPLSNLDAKLRAQMRVELIQLHKKLGATFVYVTHDQLEAMSMADNIVLMKDGVIMQNSSPKEMYHNPQNTFTAQFIGTPPMNILSGLVAGKGIGFRPERIHFERLEDAIEIPGEVVTKEQLGAEMNYSVMTRLGRIMVKTETDYEDIDCVLNIPHKSLFAFDDASGVRVPLDKGMIAEIDDAQRRLSDER